MSTGAKIGLGVGMPMAVFLGLAVGWFVFRRRGQMNASSKEPDISEISGQPMHEIGDCGPIEVGESMRHELPTTH
jgi:hypothetical protein